MTADDQTAIVVPVGAVEGVVSPWRQRLDPGAVLGVPAHVTVVFPFAPAAVVDEMLIARLAAVFATVEAFDCTFGSCRWFGSDVLWLAPDPDQPFRDLTAAVLDAFPQYLPYGGAYDDVVPHLTVGESRLAEPHELHEAEADVTRYLPLPARVVGGLLMAGSSEPGSWHPVAELPLRRRNRQVETPRGGRG